MLFTIHIVFRIAASERKLLSISLVALYLGVIVESLRIYTDRKQLFYHFVSAYAFSLLFFLPGKNEENYSFETHVEIWPYGFLFIFLLLSAIAFKEKTTAKLTEGVTLILSISFLYWMFEMGYFSLRKWYTFVFVILAGAFSLYSLVNAFFNLKLSRKNRLWLSIWSTIIVFVIAIDNIISVYKRGDIETNKLFTDNVFLFVQYFLLGISAVYIMQNYILLTTFLPSKNGNYKQDLKENINDHISRYSDSQVSVFGSVLCVFFTSGIYFLNYKYSLLPKNITIWIVIITFPVIIGLINKIWNKKF